MDNNTEHLNKNEIEEDKNYGEVNFNPVDFINQMFKYSSELDVKEYTENLFNVIETDKKKSRDLVKLHFTKYIESRDLINNLQKHEDLLKSSEVQINHILNSNNELLNKFIKYMREKRIDLENEKKEKRREYYKNKLKILFEFDEKLQDYLKNQNYKKYVEHYKKGLKLLNENKDSKFLNQLFEKNSKIQFLNKITEEIQNENNSVEEILKYFNYYFEIEKGDKKVLGNTILLNVKIFLNRTYDLVTSWKELNETTFYIFKMLNVVDLFFIENLIVEEFLKKIEETIDRLEIENGNEYNNIKVDVNKNITIYKVFLKRLKKISISLNKKVNNQVVIRFIKGMEEIEDKILKILWKDGFFILRDDINVNENKILKIIEESLKITEDNKKVEKIFKATLENYLKFSNWNNLKIEKDRILFKSSLAFVFKEEIYIENEENYNSLYLYTEYLKGLNSLREKIKEYFNFFEKPKYLTSKYLDLIFKAEDKVVDDIVKMIKITDDDIENLMTAVKITMIFKFTYKKILKKINYNSKIYNYFLSNIKNVTVELNNNEKDKIKKMEWKFNYLKNL